MLPLLALLLIGTLDLGKAGWKGGSLHGWLRKIGLGRLPGDLRFSVFGREVRVPLASALVLSLLTSWAIHWA